MSLEHSPAKQHRRARGEHLTADELKVLTIKQWAELNSLSFQTAKNMISAGDGPRIVQLTKRRIGIRVIDNRIWQEERLRS